MVYYAQKMFRKIINSLFNVLPYIFVFIASLYRPYDADLGWHLKYGEYFFKHGHILRDNIFSTSMSDYKWVNHAWGTDLITYLAYNFLGFFGLTLLAAVVITATFFFFSKFAKLTLWDKAILFPILLYFIEPINQVSFRAQLLSLFLLSVVFYIFRKSEENPKRYLLLIPLFALWANLHGQFSLGIGVLGLWTISLFVQDFFGSAKRSLVATIKKQKILLFTVVGCIIAPLANPFDIGIYKEALNHFGNPSQKFIMEWLPLESLSNLWWNNIALLVLVAISSLFYFFENTWRKYISTLFVFAVLFALSFWARRFAWAMYYFALPLLQPLSNFFKPTKEKNARKAAVVLVLLEIAVILFFKQPLTQFSTMDWRTYCRDYNDCSFGAADYLREKKLTKNLLTFYNWGGFLTWNYPDIKPSIDGRMPFWRNEKKYSGFLDYYQYEQDWKSVDSSTYDTVLISHGKPLYKRLLTLEEKGKWQEVYADDRASIFVRIKTALQE